MSFRASKCRRMVSGLALTRGGLCIVVSVDDSLRRVSSSADDASMLKGG